MGEVGTAVLYRAYRLHLVRGPGRRNELHHPAGNDKYIEGIFVSDEMQSCGIGKLLLDYVKDKKVSLRLNVYQKNARAISFYQREGFIIQCEGLDEATGEKEYTMLWKRK